MSKSKRVIELIPPDYGVMEERCEFTGFICPSCSGRGNHIEYAGKNSYMVECLRCGGSGKFRATVTIVWEGEKKGINPLVG